MKKILFLIHDLGQGGAEKVLINLVNNMNVDKFDITVMTLFDVGVNKQFLAPHIHYKTVFTRVFPGNSQVMKLFSPEFLHRQFIKEHYDIEVSYLEGPCARIISACPEKKTKKVCWIHIEQKSTEKASRSFRSKREAEKCYNKYDNIVCVSKTVQEDFSKIFSIRTSTEVLYNTNESDKIRALSKESVTECCIRSDEIKLVGVGKLLKSKGFDRILRVIERLRADGYPIHFYLLGIGPEEENLRGYVDEHGLSKSVNLLGYRTNPYKLAHCKMKMSI